MSATAAAATDTAQVGVAVQIAEVEEMVHGPVRTAQRHHSFYDALPGG
jgi:hypothetical protein